jgi:hypothetical protein
VVVAWDMWKQSCGGPLRRPGEEQSGVTCENLHKFADCIERAAALPGVSPVRAAPGAFA